MKWYTMKRILFALLCCAVFAGCKEAKKTKELSPNKEYSQANQAAFSSGLALAPSPKTIYTQALNKEPLGVGSPLGTL